MAGVKGRSGRKPDAEIGALRALIDAELKPRDWRKMIRAVATKASAEGDARAFLALAQYRFGLPTQKIAGDDALPPIVVSSLVAVEPKRAESARTTGAARKDDGSSKCVA